MIKIKIQATFHSDPRNGIEKFLSSLIPEIVDAYGLGKISFYFMTTDKVHDCHSEDGLLAINYDEIYKSAYIMIPPNAVQLFERGEQEPLISGLVHEIGHIVTHRLSELALSRHVTKKQIRDSVEETTEDIAIIARRLLVEKGSKIFKKMVKNN